MMEVYEKRSTVIIKTIVQMVLFDNQIKTYWLFRLATCHAVIMHIMSSLLGACA